MPFTVTMPKLSPTMEAGVIAKWHKKVGDKVEAGEVLLEVSTDKATVEHTALDEGYLRKILVNEGTEAVVNQPIAIFTEQKEESLEQYTPEGVQPADQKSIEMVPKKSVEPYSPKEEKGRIFASPLAKKLALEGGIDLGTLKGSGPRGRIVAKDLEQAKGKGLEKSRGGVFEEKAMTQLRKVIGQRLQKAKSTIPHFYVTQVIDAKPLVEFRGQLSRLEKKVSFNDCMIKAVALALKNHPLVNTGFNPESESLIQFKTIDISVAVTVEGGLITPIVRGADQKSLQEISEEVRALVKKAKEGKLALDQFQGGSFTLSNLGMYGISHFQAIINPPQAAILAVGGIQDVPIVKSGQVVAGQVVHLSLSADHRVIDGVLAAEFLRTLQTYLENPVALL